MLNVSKHNSLEMEREPTQEEANYNSNCKKVKITMTTLEIEMNEFGLNVRTTLGGSAVNLLKVKRLN